jgi:predicted transcriptional regulator
MERAAEFARRLKATGLTITEFQKRSGLTRNVIYNLSKGQKPSSGEQARMLEEAFQRETRA